MSVFGLPFASSTGLRKSCASSREPTSLPLPLELRSRWPCPGRRPARRVRGGRGVRRFEPAAADDDRRPARVLGPQWVPRPPGRPQAGRLSGLVGAGLDPCAAILGTFEIGPQGRRRSSSFSASAGRRTGEPAGRQVSRPGDAEAAIGDVVREWDRRLDRRSGEDAGPGLDLLVTAGCPTRCSRAGCGAGRRSTSRAGRYGFRDQLQDVLALLYAEPGEARPLLRAAGRQFPKATFSTGGTRRPAGASARTSRTTSCWLPYAVARYVEVDRRRERARRTGRYVRGPPLKTASTSATSSRTRPPRPSPFTSIASRALDRGWTLGAHGLPLMGCGDWNDGMNLVGAAGRAKASGWPGSRSWSGPFAALAEQRGDPQLAARMRRRPTSCTSRSKKHAWDGEWYLRAWFDDGTPLGSQANDECRIDSLPQSWAVLSGGRRPARCTAGHRRCRCQPSTETNRLVKLFAPPFDAGPCSRGTSRATSPASARTAGSTRTRPSGSCRRWPDSAAAGRPMRCWSMLSPIGHADTPEGVAKLPGRTVRGGGGRLRCAAARRPRRLDVVHRSAAWLYRAAVETLLGLTRRGDTLAFDPRFPAGWRDYEVEYRSGRSVYRCRVENPNGVERGIREVWLRRRASGRRGPTGRRRPAARGAGGHGVQRPNDLTRAHSRGTMLSVAHSRSPP